MSRSPSSPHRPPGSDQVLTCTPCWSRFPESCSAQAVEEPSPMGVLIVAYQRYRRHVFCFFSGIGGIVSTFCFTSQFLMNSDRWLFFLSLASVASIFLSKAMFFWWQIWVDNMALLFGLSTFQSAHLYRISTSAFVSDIGQLPFIRELGLVSYEYHGSFTIWSTENIISV